MKDKLERAGNKKAIINALAESNQSNAINERQSRIETALTNMIGREIRYPRGLLQGGSGTAPVPNFDDLPTHGSYRELSDKISALEKVIETTDLAAKAILDLGEIGGLIDVDMRASVDRFDGLTIKIWQNLTVSVFHRQE